MRGPAQEGVALGTLNVTRPAQKDTSFCQAQWMFYSLLRLHQPEFWSKQELGFGEEGIEDWNGGVLVVAQW